MVGCLCSIIISVITLLHCVSTVPLKKKKKIIKYLVLLLGMNKK